MEKKGLATGVDWIIGMAMFLLAVGFILVFFRPGITPVHTSEVLLDVIEEKFIKDSTWEINKVPVFIEPIEYCILDTMGDCYPGYSEVNNQVILLGDDDDNSLTDLLSGNSIGGNNNLEVYYIQYVESEENPPGKNDDPEDSLDEEAINNLDTDDDAENRGRIISEVFGRTHGESSENVFVRDTEHDLKFNYVGNDFYINGKTKVGEDDKIRKTKLQVVYSNGILNLREDFLVVPTDNLDLIYVACIDPEIPNRYSVDAPLLKKCKAKYEVGVSEKSKGISFVKLRALKEANLGIIKKAWGFPLNRDFKITISGEDLSSSPKKFNIDGNVNRELIFPDSVSIPDNVNVFARRFNNFILNDDGVVIPVTITIQVW